jgi:uncharacterized protein (TIRG00374 family)
MHRSANIVDEADHGTPVRVVWLSWILGSALLVAVVVAVLHFSDQRAFFRVAQQAKLKWLVLALLLQACTYVAQGSIWRAVVRGGRNPLSRWGAAELGLAKLFADQALPSAGLSSSLLTAKALGQRRVAAPAVKAAVLLNIASYHLAYVVALVAALTMLTLRGQNNPVVMMTAVLFLLFSISLSVAILALAGRSLPKSEELVGRFRIVRDTLSFVTGADPDVVRHPGVLAATIALQGTIVLLDAATMWVCIAALGAWAPATAVFASFMVASLFRTMGIVPGGLGMFEAASILTLRMADVDLAPALSATLLFRGLSFWLPMIPGYWCSRRVLAGAREQLPPVVPDAFSRSC